MQVYAEAPDARTLELQKKTEEVPLRHYDAR